MKLNIPVLLATLFSSLGSAADNCLENTCVTMGEVPSQLSVGQQVRLSWSSDGDYTLQEFALWKLEDHTRKHRANVPHLWATTKGNHSMIWTVPNVREHGGTYMISLGGRELLTSADGQHIVKNSSVWSNAYGRSNDFEISGGTVMFPSEIAGIVLGCIAGLVLLVGGFVVGARIVRKRKSVAVDLPGPGEGGYSDVRETSSA